MLVITAQTWWAAAGSPQPGASSHSRTATQLSPVLTWVQRKYPGQGCCVTYCSSPRRSFVSFLAQLFHSGRGEEAVLIYRTHALACGRWGQFVQPTRILGSTTIAAVRACQWYFYRTRSRVANCGAPRRRFRLLWGSLGTQRGPSYFRCSQRWIMRPWGVAEVPWGVLHPLNIWAPCLK